MRIAGVKLSDLLAAGGKVSPELLAIATEPAARTKPEPKATAEPRTA